MKRKNELNWTKTSKKTRDYDARDDVTVYLEGVELGDERHTASRDFEAIVKELSVKMLDSTQRDAFFELLQNYLETANNLKVSMLPLLKDDAASSFSSESLVRLLLQVPPLSDPLTELLLEKLPLVADDKSCNMAALIISQLRWLTSLSYDVIILKLTEVLPACPLQVQKEIISGVPEMLGEEKHEDVTLLLQDYITTIDLVPCVLEAFSELSLSGPTLDKIYSSVEEMLSALTADSVPAALRFLLSAGDPGRAITSIRQNIDFESLSQSGEGVAAEELSVDCLEQFLRFHLKTQKLWLTQLHDSEALSTFDVIVYLILFRVSTKDKQVLSSIRHHVKDGGMAATNIQALFEKHRKTASLYSKELLKICHALLISLPEHDLPQFIYLNIFNTGDLHARQETVGSLLSHIGSGQSREISAGIKTLNTIKENTGESLDRFSSLLSGLLDYLNALSVSQARQVLFLLVRISSGPCRTVDDLHIITRKYLSHSSPKLRVLGVIGSCCLLQVTSHQHGVEEAMGFCSKVLTSLSSSPELQALFYEELASCAALVHADTAQDLYDRFIEEFQTTYLDMTGPAEPDSQARDILCLESADTMEGNEYVAIDIWSHVQDPGTSETLLKLCPKLRLVGALVRVLKGNNMEDVDALLGCYIRTVPLDALADSPHRTRGLLALTNLLIELLNMFHVAEGGHMRNKLNDRLRLLNELLGRLRDSPMEDDLIPAVFDNLDHLPGARPAKKGQSSKSGVPSTGDLTTSSFNPSSKQGDTPATSTQVDKSPAPPRPRRNLSPWSSVSRFRGLLRELDFTVMSVLTPSPAPAEGSDTDSDPSDSRPLELPESCMLLEDLLAKCKFKLKPPSVFARPESLLGFTRLAGVSDTQFINQVLATLPAICSLMEEHVSEGAQEGALETSLFSTQQELDMLEDNPYKVKLFELVFSALELVFSWPGFANNPRVSTECFTVLAGRLQTSTQGPLSVRRRHALQYLLNYRTSCRTLSSTIGLLRCCSVISSDKDQRIADIARACLEQEWQITTDEKDNKMRFNEGVGYLVSCYLLNSDKDTSELIGEIITQLDCVVRKDSEAEKTFHTFSKATLPSIYKIVLIQLINYLKSSSEGQGETFEVLSSCVSSFATLISYIKVYNSRPLLRSALLYGQKFLELFLNVGLPVLSSMISDNYLVVQAILKKVQTPTRHLHHITCHSKSARDIALTARVPLLKKFLEAFVLKVKAMFAQHGVTDAFWVGNLKQRNLKGEEIVTQVVEEEEDETEPGEEELSELSIDTDDEEEDKENDNNSNTDSMSIGY